MCFQDLLAFPNGVPSIARVSDRIARPWQEQKQLLAYQGEVTSLRRLEQAGVSLRELNIKGELPCKWSFLIEFSSTFHGFSAFFIGFRDFLLRFS